MGEALIRVEGWKDGQIEITGVIVALRDYANVTKIATTYSFNTVCEQIYNSRLFSTNAYHHTQHISRSNRHTSDFPFSFVLSLWWIPE